MADRNLDVAMRIGTDLDQAVQDVTKLDGAYDKLKASGQSAATGLNAAATAAGKSATALKADAAAAAAAAAAHTKLGGAAGAGAAGQRRLALTAGELRNANRQLPAQLTDIVTSLISGQPAYLVAIQQGGQLKDSFGGIGAAARAVLGAISPTIVAVSAGAAAFAAIGVAAFQGYQEIQGYEHALISTGNITGTTAGQIADMADQVGEATGEFKGAEQAAQLLAESGKIAAGSLDAATRAAVDLSTLTGDSIEATTEKIIKLAEAPSAQLAKLNSQYHFLTVEVYDHVKALEDQGRAEDAARVAIEEFARVHEQRVEEARARAGALERAWHSLGDTIAGIWNGLKDLGRNDAQHRLDVAQEELQRLRSNRGNDRAGYSPFAEQQAEANVKAIEAEIEAEKKKALAHAAIQANEDFLIAGREKSEKKRKEDEQRWEQLEQSNLSKKQKLESEIAEIRKIGLALHKSDAEIEAQIAQARKRYQESLPKAPKGKKSDAERAEESAQRELENLKKQTALLGEVEAGEKRVSEEARIRYEIEHGAYVQASETTKAQLIAQAQATDAAQKHREELEKQQKELEDTQRAYERLHDQLSTPIEAAVDTVTDQIKVLNAALEKGTIDAQQYKIELAKIAAQQMAPLPDYRDALYQYGIGDPEGDRMNAAHQQLEQEYQRRLAIINAGKQQENADIAMWNAQAEALEEAHQAALTNLQLAENELRLGQTAAAFGSMASIAKTFAGEQSKSYQALFAISKGFAVAQAAVALAQNVAEASKLGWPANIGAIAAAFAQGAQIAQILAGANYSPPGYAVGGRITGPGTGTSDDVLLWGSNGEHMIRERSASQPGARAFLDDFNARGMRALRDWNGFGRYAEGGMITSSPIMASPEPRGSASAGAATGATVRNAMRVYLSLNQEQLIEQLAGHPSFEKKVVAIAGQNGNAIRADW